MTGEHISTKGRSRTLLFVGAHPDDETFGIGGTLAKYVAAGVKVYYACATRGEVGTADEISMRGFNSVGDMRWAELKCAADVLGLAGVIYLGYRDSGMAGTADNRHPEALVRAPAEEVAGRIIKVIREIRPDIVITHDPLGGYRHPDHIAVNKAVVIAVKASGDSKLYPECGPAFSPQKLYFNVFPHKWMKIAVKLMPLLGQNPHKFGRNHDIDLAAVLEADFPVHARIKLDRHSIDVKDKASLCYASQLGGGFQRNRLTKILSRLSVKNDYYMRAYPEADCHLREDDLFARTF